MKFSLDGAGPLGLSWIDRDVASLSPSYSREYALVVDHAEAHQLCDQLIHRLLADAHALRELGLAGAGEIEVREEAHVGGAHGDAELLRRASHPALVHEARAAHQELGGAGALLSLELLRELLGVHGWAFARGSARCTTLRHPRTMRVCRRFVKYT